MGNELRYWLFGGDYYYPQGGADDLVGTFSDLESTISALLWMDGYQCWAHIYDLEAGEIIQRWDKSPDTKNGWLRDHIPQPSGDGLVV